MNTLPVVILAGGMGTRIAPKYMNIPKALIPVLGRPFLSWKLNELESQGVSEVILILGKGEAAIREYIGGGYQNMKITIFSDGGTLLGTAGAIRKQIENLPEEFILTYGDTLLSFKIQELSQIYREKLLPLMVCTSYKGLSDEYNSLIQNGKVVHYSKKDSSGCNCVEYGYMVFRKHDFTKLPKEKFIDLELLITELIAANELNGIMTSLKYYEIGTPEGLEATENWLRSLTLG
jgi:N-acetyl-alpha-D-muramate 1-phosphate uridylyltransferase